MNRTSRQLVYDQDRQDLHNLGRLRPPRETICPWHKYKKSTKFVRLEQVAALTAISNTPHSSFWGSEALTGESGELHGVSLKFVTRPSCLHRAANASSSTSLECWSWDSIGHVNTCLWHNYYLPELGGSQLAAENESSSMEPPPQLPSNVLTSLRPFCYYGKGKKKSATRYPYLLRLLIITLVCGAPQSIGSSVLCVI